jgi:hypothetical protein
LTARLIAAPESLRATVYDAAHTAVQRTSGSVRGDFAEQLMAAAERLMATAVAPAAPASSPTPPTPPTALSLLTADALVTLACEWVAEREPERLGELR